MHKILYNEGAGTITWVPVDPATGRAVRLTGTPPATYTVVDLRYDEDSDSRTVGTADSSATLDATNVQLTASAGELTADPRYVALTSVTGISAGHYYEIAASDGRPETVLVDAVSSSGGSPGVYLRTPLRRTYSGGHAFRGIELTAAFDATVANDEDRLHNGAGPFLITWNYDHGGVTYNVPTQLWLTRYSVVPPVTEADILLAVPALADQSRSRFSPTNAIAYATDETVSDLGDRRIEKDYFLSDQFRSAVRDRAIAVLFEQHGDLDMADRWLERYSAKMRSMSKNLPPIGTVEIDRHDNVAPPGDSKRRRGFFGRL